MTSHSQYSSQYYSRREYDIGHYESPENDYQNSHYNYYQHPSWANYNPQNIESNTHSHDATCYSHSSPTTYPQQTNGYYPNPTLAPNGPAYHDQAAPHGSVVESYHPGSQFGENTCAPDGIYTDSGYYHSQDSMNYYFGGLEGLHYGDATQEPPEQTWTGYATADDYNGSGFYQPDQYDSPAAPSESYSPVSHHDTNFRISTTSELQGYGGHPMQAAPSHSLAYVGPTPRDESDARGAPHIVPSQHAPLDEPVHRRATSDDITPPASQQHHYYSEPSLPASFDHHLPYSEPTIDEHVYQTHPLRGHVGSLDHESSLRPRSSPKSPVNYAMGPQPVGYGSMSQEHQMHIPATQDPASASWQGSSQSILKLSTIKKTSDKKQTLACLFCRERKIACGRPAEGSPDPTCNQCARRQFKCEYPKESRRGQHKRSRRKAHDVNEAP